MGGILIARRSETTHTALGSHTESADGHGGRYTFRRRIPVSLLAKSIARPSGVAALGLMLSVVSVQERTTH